MFCLYLSTVLCVGEFFFFFFQAEDGIRDVERSRGLGDVYKRQVSTQSTWESQADRWGSGSQNNNFKSVFLFPWAERIPASLKKESFPMQKTGKENRSMGLRSRNNHVVPGGQRGFTLLEILVVLTIMGFLIAMVAPRLAGISSNASETVCNSNKYRIKTFMSSFYEQYNRYPNKLTNLVMTDGADLAAANAAAAGYQIPYCSDDDPDNGAEVLASGHNKLYKFMIHRLNDAEAKELISLGISTVFNLNDYAADADDLGGAAAAGRSTSATASDGDRVTNWGNVTAITAQRPSMEICPVEAGVGVAMCGCGIDLAGTGLTYVPVERAWAEEDLFGRIVFALGPESELVTSGIVNNAANCPGFIQNADNFSYGGYYLILPRLEATTDRLADTGVTYGGIWGTGGLDYASLNDDALQAVSWPKGGTTPSTNYDISANDEHFKVRTGLKLGEAMAAWDYDTNRDRYDEIWGIDLITAKNTLNGGSQKQEIRTNIIIGT
eukprot:TRINITY_DN2909_c0_g1_i3.p1 TRINITY_DN2909_c0_g1~~TRINITY_DN2909_c0_g1_i3.p1  ORF type:complete len:495 (-),score=95.84 TRINITY_DN2909_c0_g1_i3:1568-3052(-)